MGLTWRSEHGLECPVTYWRERLAADLDQASDTDRPALLGAVIEYDDGGDQEAELCTCRRDPLVVRVIAAVLPKRFKPW